MSRKMSQKMRILDYLKTHDCITPIEALSRFGCFRLSARIKDLRDDLYPIETKYVYKKDENGDFVKYAEYRLIKDN